MRYDLFHIKTYIDSVSQYFTKLKSVWEELEAYKHSSGCTCGALRPLLDHCHTKYVMTFLIGLNESFSKIRGQLLLMEPIPPINKVFSLVVQDEKQREVGTAIPSLIGSHMALAAKNNPNPSLGATRSKFGKKDCPLCSHCGVLSHIVEKCFKHHGYPPGFKAKSK
uniref:Retrovirus-related Pol polyprotein from transposon TNT 1-94 n=3 Tax=Cajanus cajan TaxID=3821 RepID=A0A151QZ38_CAJCA|nr:hypothetical protein KK1_043484 [Cajanus cajan]